LATQTLKRRVCASHELLIGVEKQNIGGFADFVEIGFEKPRGYEPP
jgi:hypothetical protein